MLKPRLEPTHELPAARPRRAPAVPPAVAVIEDLFTPEALGAVAPSAATLPPSLWAQALRDPVLALLQRPGKGFRQRMTDLAFRLAGGQGAPPPLLGALLEVIHAGSMIIDDIEDGSPERRGGPAVHRQHGLPLALNAGNWMYFAPLDLLSRLGLPPDAELHLHRRASRTLLDCHYGQALDLAARPELVGQAHLTGAARTISTLKTGRLLGLCAEAGAMLAGADDATATALHRFGEALGVGLQMLDDLGNLSGRMVPQRRHEDLRQGRVTWVWAWAGDLVDERAFADLCRQSQQVRDPIAPPIADEPPAVGEGRLRRCEALAANLRALVLGHGRLLAHWHLTEALAALRAQLPPGQEPALAALEGEIARLEASYG